MQVFDFGFDEASERYYIVMEYIHGRSGAELLKERGHLPLSEALDLLHGACQALDYAHRNGVIHRDVKPGNLLRSDEGGIKLADFGIAKAADTSSVTQAGSVLGTAAYLAPEQAHGEEAGPTADLYSLGVVAYQLISGHLPYEAQSLTELVLMQQEEQPARLDEFVPGVSPRLADAIDRSLELNPEERFRSVAAFQTALFTEDGFDDSPPTASTTVFNPEPQTSVTKPLQRPARQTTAEHHAHTMVASAAQNRRQEPRPPKRRNFTDEYGADDYHSAEYHRQSTPDKGGSRTREVLYWPLPC